LLHLRPDLEVVGIRGNVDTRLRKLDEGEYDAIVLAAAGLERLGWGDRIKERLSPPRMLAAPGQGALGIECREDDGEAIELMRRLDDLPTRLGVTAERTLLGALDGGCSAPIAAWGRVTDGRLLVDALVADVEGRRVLRAGKVAELPRDGDLVERAAEVGRIVADELLEQGAAELIAAARG
jgi:hydroxymethylbilane synthase